MRRQTLAALALVPALALGLPGCGDDGGAGAGSNGTAKAAGDQKKMREFAQCMRENGVDMPDPSADGKVTIRKSAGGGPGNGPENGDEIEAAQKKCRHLMPNGGKPRKPKPEELAEMRAYSKCMRDNGISEFPDPDPNGGIRIEAGKGSGMDPESKEFQDAQKACAKHGPDGGRVPAFTSKGDD